MTLIFRRSSTFFLLGALTASAGCSDEEGDVAVIAAETGGSSNPDRSNEEPEDEPVFSIGGTPQVANGNVCRAPAGSCTEPAVTIEADFEGDGSAGTVRGAGSKFYEITAQQPPAGFFGDNQVTLDLTLESPGDSNYDLYLYTANACNQGTIRSSTRNSPVEKLSYDPPSLEQGSSFTVIAEVRFVDGECSADQQFSLSFAVR